MYKIYGQKLFKNARVYYILCITLSWLAGFAIGIYLGKKNAEHLYRLFRYSVSEITSPVGNTVVFLFPLILALVAAALSSRWLLAAVAFCKGLSFSFVAACFFWAFGGAGWLVSGLFMLPNAFLSAILLWFLVRRDPFESGCLYWDAAIAAAFAFIACVLIRHFTAPFYPIIFEYV